MSESLPSPAPDRGPPAEEGPGPAPPAETAPYTLPRLPYVRLRFLLEAQEPARLPELKGSLLRGAFGHALRRKVCAVGPEQPCETCPVRHPCVYARLYETQVEGEPPPFLKGLRTAPRPYVFEPWSRETDFAPGSSLGFDLVLVGQATELAGYALLAVEAMASGLGHRRHRFRLAEAHSHRADGTWQPLLLPGGSLAGPAPAVLHPSSALPSPEEVTLRFLTPTRIQVGGRLRSELTFRALAGKMLRRTLELAHFHAPDEPVDWHLQPLLRKADGVRVARAELTWEEARRFSNRQKRSHSTSGFVGELALAGDLAPFAPLLRTAEIVHVGKGATFGLGRVEVVGDALTPFPADGVLRR